MKRKQSAIQLKSNPASQRSKEVIVDWMIGAAFVFQLTGKRYEIEEFVPFEEVWKHLTFYGTKRTTSAKISHLMNPKTKKKAVIKVQEAFLKRYGESAKQAIRRPARGHHKQGQASSTLVRIYVFPTLMEYLGVPVYKRAVQYLCKHLTQDSYLALVPIDTNTNVCILFLFFFLIGTSQL